jgi:hypothetical protein
VVGNNEKQIIKANMSEMKNKYERKEKRNK